MPLQQGDGTLHDEKEDIDNNLDLGNQLGSNEMFASMPLLDDQNNCLQSIDSRESPPEDETHPPQQSHHHRLLPLFQNQVHPVGTNDAASPNDVHQLFETEQLPPSSPQFPHTFKVLVVDDSASNRKMVCKLLAKRNVESDQAGDGLEAVQMVREALCSNSSPPPLSHEMCHHSSAQDSSSPKTQLNFDTEFSLTAKSYDLILIDDQMPRMDGPAAILEIRHMGYNGLIFGLTGNGLQIDQQKMISAGANKVMLKPLDVDDLWGEFLAMKVLDSYDI
jgi:CheY-like chemotaxis protein